MYLLHLPCAAAFRDLARVAPRVIPASAIAWQALVYLAAGGAALGAARVSWVLVESRFLALKNAVPMERPALAAAGGRVR